MKWFKHNSDAIKDEKIQLLMEQHGIVGYGIYFILCELCAEKIDKTLNPRIEIGWLFVEQLTHCRRSTIRQVLASSSTANLLLWEPNGKLLICSIPNLLKRLDNWTRDLVVTTKQLPSIEQEEEQEVKNKKKEVYIYSDLFESLWAKYPAKDGRKQAAAHFRASVLTEQDCQDIQKAIENYLGSKRVKEGYIKNGSTWFNNWRDWVDHVDFKSEEEKSRERIANLMASVKGKV